MPDTPKARSNETENPPYPANPLEPATSARQPVEKIQPGADQPQIVKRHIFMV